MSEYFVVIRIEFFLVVTIPRVLFGILAIVMLCCYIVIVIAVCCCGGCCGGVGIISSLYIEWQNHVCAHVNYT